MAEDIEQGTYWSTPMEPSARLCNFATGASTLLPKHMRWLDTYVIPVLRVEPSTYLQIAGLASRLGNAAVNERLALKRAQAVADYIEFAMYKSLINVDVGGYGESIADGKANDNDGFFRAVMVSASQYGFEPPKEKKFVKLKKLDMNQVLEKTWFGIAAKGGGMAAILGAEDTEGLVCNLGRNPRWHYFGVTSSRLGLGAGYSGGVILAFMFNTSNPVYFDGQSVSDWGFNLSLGARWDKVAKLLTKYKLMGTVAKLAKRGLKSASLQDLDNVRLLAHSLYTGMGVKLDGKPELVCLDTPIGAGAEVSLFLSSGSIRVYAL